MEKHANILYILVVFLLIFQIITFVFISIQFSRINSKVDFEVNRVESGLLEHFTGIITRNDDEYRGNFNDLSLAITQQAQQQEDFRHEIKLIKSTKEDFSGIVEDAVKSVVSVLTERSVGSGFFVNEEGYLVTNFHVISNGETIKVLTYDNRIIPAEVIGVDQLRDLALLKVEGIFNSLRLASSDELQVGKKVIAIGNPLGLSFTVTEGIISAIDREGPNGITEYIQTDVSLNPGNSGGPLINTLGEVVGINNFKIGGAESLGFALESNSIKSSINTIAQVEIIQ